MNQSHRCIFALTFFLFATAAIAEDLVPWGATWQYMDKASAPANWNSPAFEADWATGPAPLGYSNSLIKTEISFGDDGKQKHMTAWFRKSFESSDSLSSALLELGYRCDDAMVAYLNGVEIHRYNMPQGDLKADSRAVSAVSGENESKIHRTILFNAPVKKGTNHLAVAVYQFSSTSSDLLFDLELRAPSLEEFAGRPNMVLRGPYVQMGSQTAMTVVWRCDLPRKFELRYGAAPDKLDQVLPAEGILHHASPFVENGIQFEARIKGLSPDTTYYYGLWDGETLRVGGDAHHSFRTAPLKDTKRPLRFWAVGDSGTGGKTQRKVFQAMQRFVAAEEKPIDLYLHVGDMAYSNGRDNEFQLKFFNVYQSLLRNTVCWPAMGNHEGHSSDGNKGIGPYYDAYVTPTKGEVGGVPSGIESWYSFDYGSAHIVVLNSHDVSRAPDGAMAEWLKKDLAAVNSKWLFAMFHHPPYTLGTHNSNTETQLVEMRTNFMPILEAAGVDLVLSGHSHIYERTMLIDGAYHTPTISEGVVLDDGDGDPKGEGAYVKPTGLKPRSGLLYLTTGHGGTGVGRMGTIPIMKKIIVENGSVLFEMQGDRLEGWMINLNGDVRDHFVLRKDPDALTPAPLAAPWNPEGPSILPEVKEFDTFASIEIEARPPVDDAKIYYTLDGTEPNEKSPRFHGPFRIESRTLVKAFSTWADGKRKSPVSSRLYKPVAYPFKPVELENPVSGLTAQYYEGDWDRLPRWKNIPLKKTSVRPLPSHTHGERAEQFGLVYKGFLEVKTEGSYTFKLGSDDGSRMWIGDKLLIANDGVHSYMIKSSLIRMKPGYYPIKIEYFQGSGPGKLDLSWTAPGIKNQSIPASAFFHKGP
jgi:hypothetical protein